MGRAGQKRELHEIPETRAAGKEAEFQEILDRIESSGGKIIEDKEKGLYDDIGAQEFEIGVERVLEFHINGNEFKLFRKVETHKIQGGGRQKHIEEMESPRISMILKQRIGYSDDWQLVDTDMF